MGTRANGAKLHADARGTEDAAQRRLGEKAPGSRASRAGAQGAGRAKGGSLTRREGQHGMRAHFWRPGSAPPTGEGLTEAPPTRLA